MRKLLGFALMLSVVAGGLALWNGTPAEAKDKKGNTTGKHAGHNHHIRQALHHLKIAKADLLKARPIYHGHRAQALKLTEHAIHQLHLALKDNNSTGKGGKGTNNTKKK